MVADVDPGQVSLGVLVEVVGRDVVDAAVAAAGVGAKRSDGKLPPHVTAYLTMALSLFPDDDYEEVAQKVTGALSAWGCWDAGWSPPTASGITQARKRLGPQVLREVFGSVAGPAALPATRGAWLVGRTGSRRRMVAIDGFDVDLPDTDSNAGEFGYAHTAAEPGSEGRSAFPKARVVALAECGTHAFLAAQVGPYARGEKTMATALYRQLGADEVLVADRNFYSYDAVTAATASGAQLIWRAPTALRLPVVTALEDGSYLSVLPKHGVRRGRREQVLGAAATGQAPDPDTEGRLVRVVDYDVPDRDGNGSQEVITVVTTLIDPADVSADQIAAGYHERWEVETGFGQAKTHLQGPGRVLRSRSAELAYQEIWAWLTLHYAISALITRAADAAAIDPDRVSFTRVLRLIRRTATGTAAFPP